MITKNHKGTISRIANSNLAYLTEDSTGTCYSFTFGRIKNYRGEFPDEIGLKEDALVTFSLDDNVFQHTKVVHEVELHDAPSQLSWLGRLRVFIDRCNG